jgi:uncharacterized protein
VIALDTNILVYARQKDSARHAQALGLLRHLAEGDSPWAVPWPCVYEYIRVVTHPKLFRPPSDLTAVLDDLDVLFESPSIMMLGEGAAHRTHMRRMVLAGRARGNLAHDAHVAALLREHGVREFWTNDRDFRRFPGIVIRDPFDASEVHETRVRYRTRAAGRAR